MPGAEILVRDTGDKNRFFKIATAPLEHYDRVILGASHAMPLDYDDMNGVLEQASGRSIMNLSIEGGGVLPARFMLDYFLAAAFHGRGYLFPRLVRVLLDAVERGPAERSRVVPPRAARPGAGGRALEPRLRPADAARLPERLLQDQQREPLRAGHPGCARPKFAKVYKPIAQIDRQRIAYLYPPEIDPAEFRRYLGELERLIARTRDAGADFVVVKPPTPARYRDNLPDEADFDAAVAEVLARNDVPYRDLSQTIREDPYFYDTDHLNRDGITRFIEQDFLEILKGE